MSLKTYIKRGFQYIFKEYKQDIIKVNIVQKTPSELLKNRKFIITGGGSGLGFSFAKRITEEGGYVILIGRNKDKLEKAKKDLGNNCDYFISDISDITTLKETFETITKKHKIINGLINNAGVSLHEWDFLTVTEEKYDLQFETNLKGNYFLTQYYIDFIIKSKLKEASIVFISSERGTMADDLPYGLTKASINSLTKALSSKYYKKGIRINAIAPGVTATAMTNINASDDLFYKSNSGRFFVPEEVAEVLLFLLSDYSKCISGEIIHTNGGNHIKRGY